MPNTNWTRVRDLFEQAIDREPAMVEAWLANEESDARVREEVMSLLEHHTRVGSFLAEPIGARVADMFAEDSGLAAGTVVGSYTIERELGRGGMGRVYLATDGRLGRTVALKALAPRLTSDPRQRERLRREARAAAALTHPGICTVYALEEIDGDVFIASEYLEGRTLREEIASARRPPPAEVVNTARALAAALASAHARGVTHRDLKPENVMRLGDGRLKVLDFGLARMEDASPVPVAVTQPGLLVGTPAYMAPEQLNGQAVDARADVFAFGVLIHEFACGVHPFEAATPLAMAARVLAGEAPAVESCRPDLPAFIATTIGRCLRKAPEERFPSAVDLALALAAENGAPASVLAPGWWRTHQIATVAMYVVAASAAWEIKEARGLLFSLWLFILIGTVATVAGIIRGHLLFTASANPRYLADERRRTAGLTLTVDLLLAVLVGADGLLLAAERPLPGVFTMALALAIALARMLIEPATTAAAFGSLPKVEGKRK